MNCWATLYHWTREECPPISRCRMLVIEIGLKKIPAKRREDVAVIASVVENSIRDRDIQWFCADAIAAAGSDAVHTLPMLRSKVGTGSTLFDEHLHRAIDKLEALKTGNQNEDK